MSNRNPVVAYDTNTVRVTLTALRQRGLARVIHTPGARVPKHRHILDEALGLSQGEVSLLAVLALRGPQTVGELRTRTERMHDFASLAEVEKTLEGLAEPGGAAGRPAGAAAGPEGGPLRPAPRRAGRRRLHHPGRSRCPEPPPPAGAPAALADSGADWVEEDRPARAAAAPAAGTSTLPRPLRSGRTGLAALEARLAAVEADLAILQAEHRELRDELGLGAARDAPDADPGPLTPT